MRYFTQKPQMSTSWWHYKQSQEITKVRSTSKAQYLTGCILLVCPYKNQSIKTTIGCFMDDYVPEYFDWYHYLPESLLVAHNPQALFRSGINMRLGWSNHKWTALSTGVNAPKMHWGHTEIRSLRPHSEVVWVAYGHIVLAVWTHMCPGPHWSTAYSTDVLLVSGST